jgi:hypothetical protein
MPETKRPLKVFLCHIMPVGYAHIIPLRDADREPVRALYARLTQDGVDRYAWLDKAKLHGERSRTILPGQGFDKLNLPDWELEIRKAVCESIICSQEKAGFL